MRSILLFSLLIGILPTLSANDSTLVIGTYTHQGSYGIYIAHFNPATGAIELRDSIAASNPSFLQLTAGGTRIFAVEENKEGAVSLFELNPVTSKGQPKHKENTFGASPCFIDIHSSSKWLAVANYMGGSMNIFPIANGMHQDASQIIDYSGKGSHPSRQTQAHAHQSIFSPDGKFLWVVDLGLDKVIRYPFNPKKEKPADPVKALEIKLPAMTGPRHVALHPKLPIAYVLGELDGTIRVVEHLNNSYSITQTVVSDTVSQQPGSAHILLSPDNKFLYVSHRAQANMISIYEVHPKAGVIRSVGAVSTGGTSPRNFTIHPSGKWVLAANQTTNNIVVFARDPVSGMLEPTEHQLSISMPTCVQFSK